jgi:hypothetical protein
VAKMVVLVLDDPHKLQDVFVAWQGVGVSGVTVLESSGLARFAAAGRRDDLPLFPGLRDLLQGREIPHRTLFSVVDDALNLEALFAATEAVVGKLDNPHTGIMFVLPVLDVRGLHRRRPG